MSIFEVIMLVCFGVSWPVSIAKTVRTREARGKSPLFMIIICIGYLSGLAHKWLFSRDWVMLLYGFNLIMVAVDLILYYHYCRHKAAVAPMEKN